MVDGRFKTVKSRYTCSRLTDFDIIRRSDILSIRVLYTSLKCSMFDKIIRRTADILTIEKSHYFING